MMAPPAISSTPTSPSRAESEGSFRPEVSSVASLPRDDKTATWPNVGDALRAGAERLAAAGVAEPRLDARLLAAEALGLTPQEIFSRPGRGLTPAEAGRLDALLARRAAREPVSRILGRRGFWTLELALGPDTLDPRPDSETVIEAALAELPDRCAPLNLLDFGTGSGCLLLALLSELPNARGLGVDKSAGALDMARANAAVAGLAERANFIRGDWGRGIDGSFDVIVSNPPYISNQAIAGLAPEVALYDPHLALAGGDDGLECYRALAPDIARLLCPGGIAVVEVGQDQAPAVADVLGAAGLYIGGVRSDLAGMDRCVVAARGRRSMDEKMCWNVPAYPLR